MNLVRRIIGVQLRYNVRFFVEYVERSKNERADALSQGKIAKFLQITPSADMSGRTIPRKLYPLLNLWQF